MSTQNYNQPTGFPSNIGGNAGVIPEGGFTSVADDLPLFCTKEVQIIGMHLGYAIGTFSNKDGSGGLFITDGKTTLNIDENRNIHLQTGRTAIDGATGGGIQTRSDWLHTKTKEMSIVVQGVDDESTQDEFGEEETNPAFSLLVYGDVNVESRGGDMVFNAQNIKFIAGDQIELSAGSQILATASNGAGKIDLVGGEVTTKAKFAKFDLTSSFYVDGPSEITFNQKISVDPISGSIKINPLGSTRSTNTVGNVNNVTVGDYGLTTTGSSQVDANKFLVRDYQGSSTISLGPNVLYGLSEIEVEAVGSPRENSRGINAYSLRVGGAIGTSYNLDAGAIQNNAVGTIDSTAVSFISNIALTIQLN